MADPCRPSARRVLVIEDYPALAQLTVQMLGLLGHDAVIARNVAEAKQAAGEGYDLILCDLNLPDGDAHELRDALRAVTGAPLVLVSAAPREQLCLHAGFDAYLPKPLEAQALSSLIDRLCVDADGRGTRPVAV